MVDPVRPFVSALFRDASVLAPAKELLGERWGGVEWESEEFPFDTTAYYEREMGAHLRRVFWSLGAMMPPDALADLKLHALEIERRLSVDGNRRVNLDPGYVDRCKLVLASVKYNGPKVYLRDGVYADVQLLYDRGWRPTPWAFTDFRDGRYFEALKRIRG